MTQATGDVQWGNDRRRFDGYCLREADAAVRVLVPAFVDDSDTECCWRDVAAEYHRGELGLDGYTSWRDITELPGDGSFVPERVFRPAAGVLPARFCARFLQALPPRVRDQRWHTRRHDVLSVAAVVLAPPTLAGGDRGPTRTVAAVGGVAGTLPELMTAWCAVGFPGWAWSGDGRVGIAAPPYADSLVVSGPADLVVPVTTSGLEAFPVSRHHLLPRMTS